MISGIAMQSSGYRSSFLLLWHAELNDGPLQQDHHLWGTDAMDGIRVNKTIEAPMWRCLRSEMQPDVDPLAAMVANRSLPLSTPISNRQVVRNLGQLISRNRIHPLLQPRRQARQSSDGYWEAGQPNLTGTARYTFVNVCLGVEKARRDDPESRLPLHVLPAPFPGKVSGPRLRNRSMTASWRRRTLTNLLYRGLPNEFGIFLNHTRTLRFDDKPATPICAGSSVTSSSVTAISKTMPSVGASSVVAENQASVWSMGSWLCV
ncbi:hypothetical protein NMY22_g18744 [Coprinellus aureogranulatus]|nr:hypothetical protein NMY22_g18744 [Coprinellus aureogranulatus]